MLIYYKETGQPIMKYKHEHDINTIFHNRTNDFKTSIDKFVGDIPGNWKECKLVEGKFVELKHHELNELKKYERILTEIERFEYSKLELLVPSLGEIQKAETTIEILSLLQEVL